LPDTLFSGKTPPPKLSAVNAVTEGARQLTLEPDGTVVVRVLVTTLLESVCSEAGQFIKPWEMQALTWYVTCVTVVAVEYDTSSRRAT
jgi:hypothetical protein